MAAGSSNAVAGYLVFGGIKLCGYVLAARVIGKRYPGNNHNVWLVGAARTLLGMVAGALYFFALSTLPAEAGRSGGLVFLVGLVPFRIAEWWLLVWFFYDRALAHGSRGWRVVLVATLWSFALDLPAIAGAFFTGGFWIC